MGYTESLITCLQISHDRLLNNGSKYQVELLGLNSKGVSFSASKRLYFDKVVFIMIWAAAEPWFSVIGLFQVSLMCSDPVFNSEITVTLLIHFHHFLGLQDIREMVQSPASHLHEPVPGWTPPGWAQSPTTPAPSKSYWPVWSASTSWDIPLPHCHF